MMRFESPAYVYDNMRMVFRCARETATWPGCVPDMSRYDVNML